MHRAARRIDLAAADSSEASRLRAGPAHSGPSHALTASRGQTPEQPTPRALIPASFAASRSRPAPFRQQRAPVHIVKPSEGASAAEAARQKPTIMQKRISHDCNSWGRGFAVHSSSFTQAHVRATHHRRDVGAAAGADAGQTPDMPPLRCAHASGPPEANALRATYRVATPCTGPPSGRVGWAFTHTRRGGPASAVASSPLPRRHIMHLPSGSRAPRAWFSSARNLPTLPPHAELTPGPLAPQPASPTNEQRAHHAPPCRQCGEPRRHAPTPLRPVRLEEPPGSHVAHLRKWDR